MFSWIKQITPNDVFTPASIAQKNYVKRDYLIERLESYLRTPGKQLVVYGYSGSGKTTLVVNELKRLSIQCVKSQCSSDSTYNSLMLSCFDSLGAYYIRNYSKSQKSSVQIEYSQIQGSIESSASEIYERVVPPQLTSEKLAYFLGEAKRVWLIEDFHKLKSAEKQKVADVLKVFIDNSDRYPETRIICLGAVTSSRELIEFDPNLANRLADINVPLLTDDEISSIIRTGFKLLGVRIDESIQERLAKLSNNIGSVAHQLSLNICTVLKIKRSHFFNQSEVKNETIDSGIKMYVEEQAGRFQLSLDAIFAIENKIGEKIIKALVNAPIEGLKMEQIISKVGQKGADCEKIVKELCSNQYEEVIRYNEYSMKFQISNSFFSAFVKLYIESKKKKKSRNYFVFNGFLFATDKRFNEYVKVISNLEKSRDLFLQEDNDKSEK